MYVLLICYITNKNCKYIYDFINYVSLIFMHNIFNKNLSIHITKFEYKINYDNIRNNALIENKP